MPYYSPTTTTTWLTCPIKRLLSADGWHTIALQRRDLAAMLGTLVHTGLEAHYSRRPPGPAIDTKWATILAEQTTDGRHLPEYLQSQHTAIPKRAHRVLDAYPTLDPLGAMTVREIETYYETERVRPDLVVYDGRSLAVVDFKSTLTLDVKAVSFRQQLYANSWQMLHGAHAVGQRHGTRVETYYIVMIVCEPKPHVYLWDYPIHPSTMTLWQASAERVWAQMALEDEGKAQPWQTANHADQFGPCEYYAACFEHRYDPQLMAATYVQTKRGP